MNPHHSGRVKGVSGLWRLDVLAVSALRPFVSLEATDFSVRFISADSLSLLPFSALLPLLLPLLLLPPLLLLLLPLSLNKLLSLLSTATFLSFVFVSSCCWMRGVEEGEETEEVFAVREIFLPTVISPPLLFFFAFSREGLLLLPLLLLFSFPFLSFLVSSEGDLEVFLWLSFLLLGLLLFFRLRDRFPLRLRELLDPLLALLRLFLGESGISNKYKL